MDLDTRHPITPAHQADSMEEIRYIYKPLNSTENSTSNKTIRLFRRPFDNWRGSGQPRKPIRLLTVHPGVGTSPVRCSLRLANLSSKPTPSYETISYSWGDASLRKTLMLDTHSFSAPASSVDAIRRMRFEHRHRVLWIDAVCINQDDVLERNHQVAMMKDVYSKSKGNLIYLGEPDGTEAEVFSIIHAISEGVTMDMQRSPDLRQIATDQLNEAMKKKPTLSFGPLMEFLSRPWFSRVWVFQEAVLAPSSTCFYGSYEVPLVQVFAALMVLRNDSEQRFFSSSHVRRHPTAFNNLIHLNAMSILMGIKAIDIAQALQIQRSMMATDPRDRVYGMLGLIEHSSDDHATDDIEVDYERPVAQVMRDATWNALIEERATLDIILRTVSHKNGDEVFDENWRSWVPRWDRPWDWEEEPAALAPLEDYSASNSARFDSLLGTMPSDTLRLRGFSSGIVSGCSSTLTSSIKENAEELLAWLREVQAMTTSPLQYLGSTLVSNMDHERKQAIEEFSLRLPGLMAYLQDKNELPPRRDHWTPYTTLNAKEISQYHMVLCQESGNRRFFNSNAENIGIGPKVMEEGDILAVLRGCRLPCVLRKFGERYKLLGLCHVHGLETDEALKAHVASCKANETFEIC